MEVSADLQSAQRIGARTENHVDKEWQRKRNEEKSISKATTDGKREVKDRDKLGVRNFS